MPPGSSPAADAERNARTRGVLHRRTDRARRAPIVCTGPVRMSGLGHSRRRVLAVTGTVTGAGFAATTLGGCGFFGGDPEPPEAPDPLQPLLDEAMALAAAYDRVTVTQPGLAGRLSPLADDHRAHA